MIKEILRDSPRSMVNDSDFKQDPNYVLTDMEKARMVKKLGTIITDRAQKKIFHSMGYDDPEYWAIDRVFTKEEVKFLLSFKKTRIWYYPEELAERNGMTMDETMKMLDHLLWVGFIEINTENEEHRRQYMLPPFVPGSAEHMMGNREFMEQHPEIATFFNLMSQVPLQPINQMVPPGGGGIGMHVIPIEKAIEHENSSIDIEHISHWLDKYDIYSLAYCSCRRQQRIRGEGDGSIEGEFCISVGDMARFVIETNRGREISKEECLEIFERAERNGLVHQITNIDGKDKIFSICNCAPGVCNGIRTSQLFNSPNLSRSAYIAHVNDDNCVACGKCAEICPVGAVKLGRRIRDKNGEGFKYPKSILPDDELWGENQWNPHYRETAKENCYETGTAPCKAVCPAHIAVQGYIQMAKEGRYMEALKLIKEDNPFPAVCGAICNRKCEEVCTRGKIDDPVAIDEIKKFISAQELNRETRYVPLCENEEGKMWDEYPIAVIGSGPSGLSCAYYLRKQGYPVTVFEKDHKPGGMLMNGIPNFRLEKDVVDAEIEVLREMGVEFVYDTEIGKDITLVQLRDKGYKAFYVAIGAQGGKKARIPGEDSKGVVSGVQFLKDVNLGRVKSLKGKAIVIGGGNVAIDVARTAVRLGAEVELIYRRSREEMPADQAEVQEAIDEGVILRNGWAPEAVKAEKGKMKSMSFKAFSDNRTPYQPGVKAGDKLEVEADHLLVSIGQSIEWGDLLKDSGVVINRNGTAVADYITLQTDEPDIFVGGDVYTGPSFAINAIAAGKEGAESIHRFVHEGQSLTIGRDLRRFEQLDTENFSIESFDNSSRQEPGVKKGNPVKTFDDLRKPLSAEQVKKEASRCLGCGLAVVDENRCIGCGLCTVNCNFDAIRLERDLPEASDLRNYDDLALNVGPYTVKRAFKITGKKVKKAVSDRLKEKH